MKILAMLSVLSTIIICPPSQARSMQVEQREILRNVQINGEKTTFVADMRINFMDRKIKIDIMQDRCGHYAERDGALYTCMAMPTKIATIEAPLTDRRADGCGSTIYTAFEDRTPVDGLRTEIRAIDNTRRVCENVIESVFIVEASEYAARTQYKTTYRLLK